MDESVRRSIGKWPNVPAVYGWLFLDRRGRWLLQGRPVTHERSIAFIGRNYTADDAGRWLFQNGPQRVYVRLAYTPWIYRLRADREPAAAGSLETHTGGQVGRLTGAWIDETGSLLLRTEHGIGLLDDRDLPRLIDAFCDREGAALDDEVLAARIALLQESFTANAAIPAGLCLEYAGKRCPLGLIRSREVPARFAFEPDPRPSD